MEGTPVFCSRRPAQGSAGPGLQVGAHFLLKNDPLKN